MLTISELSHSMNWTYNRKCCQWHLSWNRSRQNHSPWEPRNVTICTDLAPKQTTPHVTSGPLPSWPCPSWLGSARTGDRLSHPFSLPWLSRVAAWGKLRGRFSRGTDWNLPWNLRIDCVDCRPRRLPGAASRWSWWSSWWLLWFSPRQGRYHLSRVLAAMFLTFAAVPPKCYCYCSRWYP